MKKFSNLFFDRHELLRQLDHITHEAHHIRSLATALVKTDSSEETREVIVNECKVALNADAICLYLLQPRGYYEMIAERGCSKEFKDAWYRLYPEKIPLIAQNKASDTLFFGSPTDFKREFPNSEKIVDQSNRKLIAYAPLVVNKKPIGLLGFSYNEACNPPDKQFAMTLVNLCAQAIERARLLELERLSRQEAEAANKAKTAFLSSMSHEIRAPISTIIGFADLIYNSNTLQANQKNWIWRILQNARHLSGLIGDVLDISKIEANKIEVCNHIFSLNEFIEDVKAVTTFKAEEKGVQLVFQNINAHLDIRSDAIHLRQILINLIGNAIKFTPSGGQVEVLIDVGESRLHLEVKDSGIGIADEDKRRIFEPFTKLETGTNVVGTGLGLSISKKLAVALGGDLFLQRSAPGEGSTFILEISCESFATQPNTAKPLERKNSRSLKGLNVLIVDDSIDNQIVVKCYLMDEGAQVDTADNGKAGVEKAFRSDYDVVIMDIQMPELDGNQAVSQLRSRGYKKPVVALTAEVLALQKEESLQRGFDEYLIKPINRELLVQTLSRLTYDSWREKEIVVAKPQESKAKKPLYRIPRNIRSRYLM
jgi:signal transduction histidine kinase/AmiR/NasT family two-component response regulator